MKSLSAVEVARHIGLGIFSPYALRNTEMDQEEIDPSDPPVTLRVLQIPIPRIISGNSFGNDLVRAEITNVVDYKSYIHDIRRFRSQDLSDWVDIHDPLIQQIHHTGTPGMVGTKICLRLHEQLLVNRRAFLEDYEEYYLDGLHEDLLQMIEDDEIDVFIIPLNFVQIIPKWESNRWEISPEKDWFTHKQDLFGPVRVMNNFEFSSLLDCFKRSKRPRTIYGVVGEEELTGVFFGNLQPKQSERRSYIAFAPISLLQAALSAVCTTMCDGTFLRFISRNGLLMPEALFESK